MYFAPFCTLLFNEKLPNKLSIQNKKVRDIFAPDFSAEAFLYYKEKDSELSPEPKPAKMPADTWQTCQVEAPKRNEKLNHKSCNGKRTETNFNRK